MLFYQVRGKPVFDGRCGSSSKMWLQCRFGVCLTILSCYRTPSLLRSTKTSIVFSEACAGKCKAMNCTQVEHVENLSFLSPKTAFSDTFNMI